ncbi:MAG TPA: PAS domain S-box protein, partial [Archangium sp.]
MKSASLRTYLLMLVVVASVPLVTAAIYDVFEDLEDARANSRTTLRTLAITTVGNTTARLNAIHESLQRLAWKRLPESGADRCQDTLDDFLPSCSHCVDLFVTTPSGEITCASRLPNGGRRTGTTFEAPWREREGAPNPFDITASYRDPLLDELSLLMRIPLQGESGTLNATLRADVLDPHIPTNFLPPETRFGFISETGVIIWRNQDPERLNATAPDGGAQMAVVAQHDGEFEAPGLDGLHRMFSVVPMPDTRWVAFISVPLAWVNEEPIERAKSTTRTAVLAIVALVLLGVLMARRITQPVVELQRVARRAQHGDLEAQAPVQGPLELAAVAEALNELVVARRHSERELRAFLENSAVIAWMKDEQGRYTFASDNMIKRFGFTRERMIGRSDAELWPEAVVAQFRQTDSRSLDTNAAVEFVQKLPNPDGTWSSWLAHKFIFHRADGQPLVGGLAVDITRLEQAEVARRVADESLTQTFTTSPIGMALRTLDDRFFRVNESLCRMLGYSEAELLEVRSIDLTAEADRERANAEAALLLAGKTESVQSEKRYVHKLGHEVWVQRTLSLVRDEKGQPLHFLAQVQDISERKSAETSARLAVV